MKKKFWLGQVLLLLSLAKPLFGEESNVFEDGQIYETITEEEIRTEDEENNFGLGHGETFVRNKSPNKTNRSQGFLKKRNALGISAGPETLGEVYHLRLFPILDGTFWNVFGRLGLPVRFPVYDAMSKREAKEHHRSHGFVSAGQFIVPRRSDFQSAADIQKIVRHLEIGEPEDRFFLKLSRSESHTLGQGLLVKNMRHAWVQDDDPLFASSHLNFDPVQFSLLVGPLPLVYFLGLSFQFAPFDALKAVPYLQGSDAVLDYAADFSAPFVPIKAELENNETAYLVDKNKRHLEHKTALAQGFGLSLRKETKLKPWLGLMPKVGLGNLLVTSLPGSKESHTIYGAGLHVSFEGRFYLPAESTISIQGEARVFSPYYWPGYFNPTYAIDRHRLARGAGSSGAPFQSKALYLSGLTNAPWRLGYALETGYSYSDLIDAHIQYENAHGLSDFSNIEAMRNLGFFLGFIGMDPIQILFGYEVRFIEEMKEVFDFNKTNTLLSVSGRIKLLPFLYFDAWAEHAFGLKDLLEVNLSKKAKEGDEPDALVSRFGLKRSFNFGAGVELAMEF